MRVAVTGGSGQLGSLVLRRLLDRRAVTSVVSLDVRPPRVASPKLRVVTADVRERDFARHLEGCDALVHLAFVVARHLPRAQFDAINVEGSKNVLRAAARAGVARVVYSSSIAAYGVVPGHPVPLREDAPRVHQPEFPYAAAKHQVEAFLDAFEREHPALAVARLRPAILVGEVMEHPLGASLRRRLVPDASDTPFPIVWDEDVADAALLALDRGARGAFNLCADELLPPAQLARRAGFRVLPLPRVVLREAARLGALAARLGLGEANDPAWSRAHGATLVPTSERARRELGWRPRCNTAVDVLRRYDETVPRRLDPRVAVFLRAADLAARRAPPAPEAADLTALVHLRFAGPTGGDYALAVKRGRARLLPGAPRPPTAVLTLQPRTFLDLLAGRTDVVSAQRSGRLRVEGDASGPALLAGLVARFRAQTAEPSPRGWVARRLARWFARGGEGAPRIAR